MNWGGFNALSNWWLALLVAPLVLFYFLKLKRPRLEIPSLALWRQVLRDQRVNSPFQKFKRNLLLLLQILLLLLLVLAALQPFWRGRAAAVRRLPVLIDCSASMAALDKPGGVSRLDEAKRRVRELTEGLTANQQFCLISFGNAARKRTGFTNDKRLLREVLDQLQVEEVPSDLEGALRLVQALARSDPFDEVLLFSDGNLPSRANFDLSFKLNYQRLAVGGPNMGLTALAARRSIDGGWELFAQVEGSAGANRNATLTLRQDGQSTGNERLTLAGGRAQRLVFRIGGEKASALQLKLEPDGFDSLAVDNTAALELPAARVLRVFVPQSLWSYRRALAGIRGLVVLPQETGDEGAGEFDLVISDRAADLGIGARTRVTVGFVPPALQSLVSIETNGTQVVDWRHDAWLLRHIELGELVILDRPMSRDGVSDGDYENLGYEVLVHGHRGPLLLEKREGDKHSVALLFNTDRSTLPYRVGFPILAANFVHAAMEDAGLAEVRGDRRRGNLLSPSETLLASVEHLEFNERLTVAAVTAPLKTDRALWRPLVLLALGTLLVEWWYFQRKPGGWK